MESSRINTGEIALKFGVNTANREVDKILP